ncbi:hypothetical protein B0A52_01729 [Exophiala mesophila]|uniref:Uncharacterized protein n=1 Tax=Exophiala mesophila TaxID=212818 RepID=A0A438NFV2_EXOME|nr:hypothetical protein B0A52_01729 [Exophiala mesophila]
MQVRIATFPQRLTTAVFNRKQSHHCSTPYLLSFISSPHQAIPRQRLYTTKLRRHFSASAAINDNKSSGSPTTSKNVDFWPEPTPSQDAVSPESADSVDSDEKAAEEAKWESILEDAFFYGIRSKSRLLFESDVGHLENRDTRLTDLPPARQNIDFWLVLLRAQALHNGHDGIKAIYHGITSRGTLVRLEGDHPSVSALWQVFLAAGSVDFEFLRTLAGEALSYNLNRPYIFREIVGAALEGDTPARATELAQFLYPRFRGKEDLSQIFLSMTRSNSPRALTSFCKVYSHLPRGDIYADVIPQLWSLERISDAFDLHFFLLSKGDLPPTFEALQPLIVHLVHQEENGQSQEQRLNTFLGPLKRAGASFEAQIRRFWALEASKPTEHSPETLNTVAHRQRRQTPRKFSDTFVARAFATRAIPFEFTVNSLIPMGLTEVGPQSVREMVSSSPDLATVQNRFKLLQDRGIDTGSSAYVRTLRNTASAGRWEILRSLVDNDMHHQVFEDENTQLQFLLKYYRSNEWPKLNRTLAVLNLGNFGEEANRQAQGFLLRAMAQLKHHQGMIRLLSDMRMHREKIPMIDAVVRDVLVSQRADIHRDLLDRKRDSDLTTVHIGILQQLAGAGALIPLRTWQYSFFALGKADRLEAFARLSYWLAEFYQPNAIAAHYDLKRKRLPARDTDLRRVFTPDYQRGLMAWAFRPRSWQSSPVKTKKLLFAERCLRWAPILKRLRDQYNVPVDEEQIQEWYLDRVRMLFSISNYGFEENYNNVQRERNPHPYWLYWALYDARWQPRSKPLRYEKSFLLLGLFTSGRQERRYKLRQQRLSDTRSHVSGPAEIRAALAARDAEQEETDESGFDKSTKEDLTASSWDYGPSRTTNERRTEENHN